MTAQTLGTNTTGDPRESYVARHPAAFINAIAEEGTKAEAIEWLQRQWDENCELRAVNREMLAALRAIGEIVGEAGGR